MMEVDVRVGTLRVRAMTGKDREVVDMMEKGKADIPCVQEKRWKQRKSRELGEGNKLYYHGEDGIRNCSWVVVNGRHTNSVLELKRAMDRMLFFQNGGRWQGSDCGDSLCPESGM